MTQRTRLRRDQILSTLLAATLLLNLFFLPTQTGVVHAADTATIVQTNFTGLEDLGPDYVYEGWIIVNGSPVSAGRFTVDAMGNPSQTDFAIEVDQAAVSTYVLTIEPAVGDDPAPAPTHILAGDFAANEAPLTIGHGAALGDDFTSATGEYILGIPTDDGTSGATYANGIWFLNPAAPARMTAGLDLPTLPAGWAYEGWVVVGGTPYSTGTFLDAAMADSDGGGATAGPNAAPPFPGQDYVTDMLNLVGGAAVISIEPVPDNSPAPFTLKPLVDGSIDDTGGPGIVQAMGNNAAGAPTGTAKLLDSADFSLTCNGLEDLGSDYVYEGWLIDGGNAVSTGRFSVDANGVLSNSSGVVGLNNVGATPFVLTIEPAVGDVPAPADTHILAGDVVGGSATATVAHGAALGDDFTSATGEYILGIPTDDGTSGATYANGIWFLNPATPSAGLDLPTLPAGWAYEGWVVVGGTPYSTGTFLDAAMADSDGGGAMAGPNAAPPFPGQDYVTNMLNLIGGAAVISIEPVPDNSLAPFTLKPLVDGSIDDTGGPGIVQAMGNNASAFPTCEVTVQVTDVLAVGLDTVSADTSNALVLTTTLTLLGLLAVSTLRLRKND